MAGAEDTAKQVVQVFSGTAFAVLAVFVAISTTESVKEVRDSGYSRRLKAAVGLALYVAQFSSFFNYFQLTEIDDVLLARPAQEGAYSMDMSRPIEWICTCPLLQLALVLIGGNKIPYYRAYLMPGIALSLLLLGVASTLIENVIARVIIFILSFTVFSVQCYFNRKQIIEATDGQEGLFSGRSIYRLISIMVILTWLPFPFWYLMTPEGFGVIENLVVIEIGWAVLNIVAKFSFVILVFKINRKYQLEQEELRKGFVDNSKKASFQALAKSGKAGEQKFDFSLMDLAKETFAFLGMEYAVDLFVKRLKDNHISSIPQLEEAGEQFCRERSLPWELVRACQLRLYVKLDAATSEQKPKPQEGETKLNLLEAMLGTDVSAIEKAKEKAVKVKVDNMLISKADARIQKLRDDVEASKSMKEVMQTLIKGKDVKAIETGLAAMKVTGCEGIAAEEKALQKKLTQLKKNKKDAAQFYKKGTEMVSKEDWQNAVETLSKAIPLLPPSEQVPSLLSRCAAHEGLKDWGKVVLDASKILAADPKNAEGRACFARGLAGLGQEDAAMVAAQAELDAALEMDPDNASALEAKDFIENMTLAAEVDQPVPGSDPFAAKGNFL
eukprot:TRINITY_DN9729_c1_g1_i1.p1 TRINITY_DN9729_c1_g1~~TRINITY_DN9729_c1_g1_i1.p1  ORF type:complete len:612 (+),score=178.85 TRINITY_DN9729_c1_g1_i1:67-1902(+)